jgi:excisionase family DNA binding protein
MRKTAADEPLLDVAWLADYLGVPVRTVYSWRLRDLGPPAYVVGRHLKFRKSEVDLWLRERHDSDDDSVGS